MDELITVFADGSGSGWVDLCAQFSRPLPLLVINQMFGFPVEQGDDVFMDAWRMVDSGPDAAASRLPPPGARERPLRKATRIFSHFLGGFTENASSHDRVGQCAPGSRNRFR